MEQFPDRLLQWSTAVRLPINPPTVLVGDWWNKYTSSVIDIALNQHRMNVILCPWDSKKHMDGRIDNFTEFVSMWQTVITKYQNNSRVYFEVFNEPWGYNLTDLKDIYMKWLDTFPNVARSQIILMGYQTTNSKIIGDDDRFSNCLLSTHIYAFYNRKLVTEQQWRDVLKSYVGDHYERTMVTEFGVTMTTGINYMGPVNNNSEIAFFKGTVSQIKEYTMSSCYWPGLRQADTFSIQLLNGYASNASSLFLTNTNIAGVEQLKQSWFRNI
jgi:endoglucanase